MFVFEQKTVSFDDAPTIASVTTTQQLRQITLDRMYQTKSIDKPQYQELTNANKNGDMKKFNQLLDEYGIKQQFYDLLKLVQVQMQSKAILTKAADDIQRVTENVFLDKQLVEGKKDFEAYEDNLKEAKKKGREYQGDNAA